MGWMWAIFCGSMSISMGGYGSAAGGGPWRTNDFRGCHPRGETELDPISLVCKLMTVEGRPAVKLSDNARKATGPESEIARYRRVFGSVAVIGEPVTV